MKPDCRRFCEIIMLFCVFPSRSYNKVAIVLDT